MPEIWVASASVTVIVTPPRSLTISFTASKFTVTNSVISKSKFVFRVLKARVGPPYEYAWVTLSKLLPVNSKYVSLYTDTSLTSFVLLFILAITIQSLLFPRLYESCLLSIPRIAIFL